MCLVHDRAHDTRVDVCVLRRHRVDPSLDGHVVDALEFPGAEMRGDVAPLHALACLGVRIRRGGPPAGHEARPEVLVERRAAAELDEHFMSRAER